MCMREMLAKTSEKRNPLHRDMANPSKNLTYAVYHELSTISITLVTYLPQIGLPIKRDIDLPKMTPMPLT